MECLLSLWFSLTFSIRIGMFLPATFPLFTEMLHADCKDEEWTSFFVCQGWRGNFSISTETTSIFSDWLLKGPTILSWLWRLNTYSISWRSVKRISWYLIFNFRPTPWRNIKECLPPEEEKWGGSWESDGSLSESLGQISTGYLGEIPECEDLVGTPEESREEEIEKKVRS